MFFCGVLGSVGSVWQCYSLGGPWQCWRCWQCLAVPLLEPDIPLISREDFYKYVYKCFGVLVASVKELECRKSEKN